MNSKNVGIVVIALVVIGLATYQFMGTSNQQTTEPMTSTRLNDAEVTITEVVESSLADGTYEATGNYTSPNGPETIEVTITLTDGLITEAEVVPQAVNPTSVKMQNSFKEGFKEQVIGKPITEVKLTKVSASSLTPQGFNEALQEIIGQAQNAS